MSLLISQLDYCNSLVNNITLENIHKLQLIQNHAARLVKKKASKRSSAKLLLKDLHWLPVKDRIIYKFAVLVCIIINDNSSPSYVRELITVTPPPPKLRDLFVPKQNILKIPRKFLKTFGERSFSHATPEKWNKLTVYIKSSRSTPIFKNNLETHLFRCSFQTM